VNDTITAIISGSTPARARLIRTFDWTTKMYQDQPIQFNGSRQYCSCGLLKVNGQRLVAVAGKSSQVSQTF